MNTIPNMPGENPSLPFDPRDIPPNVVEPKNMAEKGTIEAPNLPLLGVQIIDDMKHGVLTRTEFETWTKEPWKAYETLAGRVNAPEGADRELMMDLQEWYFAGRDFKDNPEAQAHAYLLWETHHSKKAKEIRNTINKIYDRANLELAIVEHTKQEREKEAKGNVLENAVTGTWEYLKNWQDHKVMTAALLFTGYMLFQKMKGKRITNLLGWAVGIGAVTTLLRKQFGIKVTELPAQAADSVGMTKLGDFFRETKETLMRPFGAEGEKSEISYMQETLRLTGDNEQAMFTAFSTENPRRYFDWYDQAKVWSVSSEGIPPPLPENMNAAIGLMRQRGTLPEQFDEMDVKAKTYLLLNVSDKYFDQIGVYAETGGKKGNAIAYIKDKYVTGDYYDRLYNEWLTEWKKAYGEETGAYARVSEKTKAIIDMFKNDVKNGSDVVNFSQVLRLEMPQEEAERLYTYDGKGKSLSELYSMLNMAASSAMDIAVNTTNRSVEYVVEDVPQAARKLLREVIAPKLASINLVNEEKFIAWMEGFVDGFKYGASVIVDDAILPALEALGIGIGYGIDAIDGVLKLSPQAAEKLHDEITDAEKNAVSENEKHENSIEMPTPAEEPEIHMPLPEEDPGMDLPMPEKQASPEKIPPAMPSPEPSDAPEMPLGEEEEGGMPLRDTTRAKP